MPHSEFGKQKVETTVNMTCSSYVYECLELISPDTRD